MKIERGRLAGLIIAPLGYRYSGIVLAEAGLTLLARRPRELSFMEIAAPPETTRVLGFAALVVRLRGGGEIRIAGLRRAKVAEFAASATQAWRCHVVGAIEQDADELHELSKAIRRLRKPKAYPAACLVEPYADRVRQVAERIPVPVEAIDLPEELAQNLAYVRDFHEGLVRSRDAAINTFVKSELTKYSEFFDRIETNPLTEEQRLSVVTDEDATLVLASAGSGKTSVIVAKTAYLIHRCMRRPDEILLLAFGKDAAAGMASRIEARTGEAVKAMTFHALGLDIIREVEKGTPALAQHASDDAQLRLLLKDILIQDVATQPQLGGVLRKWFSEFLIPYKSEWDFKTRHEYYEYVEAQELRTLQGEVVKSFEELEIANWLSLNGIVYEYEPDYEHELRGTGRKSYTPDFRLSVSGVYIEHFGVRKIRSKDGRIALYPAPHIDRKSYLLGMEWKRKIHRDHGTTLIETFSYERVEGRLTDALAEKLKPYAVPDPIPMDVALRQLLEHGQADPFTPTLGTFLRHYKSSGLTLDLCRQQARKSADKARGEAFLEIFSAVFEAYERRLANRMDFEDMITRAIGYLESGRYRSPYRHLLVDEFQDISAGRARLLLALKAQHRDVRIFAVGDDWQSIYRFSGSDGSLMRNFGRKFGGAFAGATDVCSIVDLGRTFRSVDRIALPARHFVLRNPEQITKKVIAAGTSAGPAIKVMHTGYGDEDRLLAMALKEIQAASKEKCSVLLLGRFHFKRPTGISSAYPGLSIRFMTVHASKGLEADHVVILGANSGRMGFPSEIVDDPLLDLVLPVPEAFEHAEERRLFYVALTRARRSVTILADRENPSSFVRELLRDPEYGVIEQAGRSISKHACGGCGGRMLARTTAKGRKLFACEHRRLCGETVWPCAACGKDIPVAVRDKPDRLVCSCGASHPACPKCAGGWLVERRGQHGKFLGCVRFPDCDEKRRLPVRRAG